MHKNCISPILLLATLQIQALEMTVTLLECLLCCDHTDLMHAMCTHLRLSDYNEYFGYKQGDNVAVLGRLGLHFPDVIMTPQEQYGDIIMFLFCFCF